MKLKGFMSDGNIFVTKKGIDKPYVLFHEYAHIYALRNADYGRLEETAKKMLTESQIDELVNNDIRYKTLIAKKNEGDEEAKNEYSVELFATAMGQFFKGIENELPSYKDFSDFQDNFANDVKKLAPEDFSVDVYNVAKSLVGIKPKYKVGSIVYLNEHPVTINGFDGEKYEVVFIETNQSAEVSENELTEILSVETKKKKTKKATAKKSTDKPKKATKKAKVADKPKYEIGTILEDDSIIIGYKNGKYQIVTKNDELIEMTEKEIEEA